MATAETKLIEYPGKIYRYFMHDSLRRNSTFLITSQAITAGAAFIFWVICARLYKTSDVGLATAFISFGALVATFTNLGLPNTIVRFLPTSKKRGGLFTGSLYIVLGTSILGGLISLSLINVLVPKFNFVQSSVYLSLLLILLVVCNATSAFLDGSLMAFRKGKYILGKALIINIPRIILPFFVVALAMRGIVTTYVVVFIFGIAYNLIIILSKLLKDTSLKPTMGEVSKHRGFAAGNYFGGMFGILPSTLVPLIILSKLGAVSAAYFYMPMQIAVFLGIIASSTSQAMVSESSQNDDETSHVMHFKNAFKHAFSLLIPTILLTIILGWPVLLIYGHKYAETGYVVLVTLAVASIFVAINWLGDTWLNVKKRSKAYFFMNAFNSIAVILGVYLLAAKGLEYAAIGWLIGQIISAIVYLIIFARGQLFSFASSFKTS